MKKDRIASLLNPYASPEYVQPAPTPSSRILGSLSRPKRIPVGHAPRIVARRLARAKLIVRKFNEKIPVGTSVEVELDDGTKIETVVRAPATILSDHTPVAWLEGISACYLLSRVSAPGIELFPRYYQKAIRHRRRAERLRRADDRTK